MPADMLAPGLFFLVVIAIQLVFNQFAKFSYRVDDDGIDMTWRVLGILTVRRGRTELRDVRDVRRRWLGPPAFSYIFGRLYTTRGGIVLVLRRREWMHTSVYITPENPDAFVACHFYEELSLRGFE